MQSQSIDLVYTAAWSCLEEDHNNNCLLEFIFQIKQIYESYFHICFSSDSVYVLGKSDAQKYVEQVQSHNSGEVIVMGTLLLKPTLHIKLCRCMVAQDNRSTLPYGNKWYYTNSIWVTAGSQY